MKDDSVFTPEQEKRIKEIAHEEARATIRELGRILRSRIKDPKIVTQSEKRVRADVLTRQ